MVVTMTEETTETVESNELQAFVASTLEAIMKGISDAQDNARVRSAFGTGEFAFSAPEKVSFDVAVTAKHSGSARGGFKIQVFGIGANAGGDISSEAATVSRIQFEVPSKFKRDGR